MEMRNHMTRSMNLILRWYIQNSYIVVLVLTRAQLYLRALIQRKNGEWPSSKTPGVTVIAVTTMLSFVPHCLDTTFNTTMGNPMAIGDKEW